MKRVGFITTNRVFAQGLAAAIKNRPELKLEPILILNSQQTILDADLSGIDIAVIDVMDMYEDKNSCSLCERLRKVLPNCRLLLLVAQNHPEERKAVIDAIRQGLADDFVFHDTSLDYLLAKLAAL
jgi:DNA-binding NarL/FixJ family response regulator